MLKETFSLADYVAKHHNNKPVSFARTTDKTPQQVRKQIAMNNFIVVGNDICQIKYQTDNIVHSKTPLTDRAIRNCIAIYKCFSAKEVQSMPISILDAWRTGKELDDNYE